MPSESPRMNAQPIKIAILAMGGEGGGVLADWIVDLGERNGYLAQTTSVPGVAQRTGATIYYLELFPQAQAASSPHPPVLALMPLPGDVDVVLASEAMEAGRAVQRGLVTPERTTLIASTHRVYAIAEKMAMGDGRVDEEALLRQTAQAAKRVVRFDMAQTAEDNQSVISAVLFGALCASGVLPFSRAQFEATISRGSVGVQASLRAFAAAHARAEQGDGAVAPAPAAPIAALKARDPQVQALLDRMRAQWPAAVQGVLADGLRRLVDYQDPAYGDLYLSRLARLSELAPDHNGLIQETARHLALWMAYEDTIRVADLKTRQARFERVRQEVRLSDKQELAIHEFLHPRLEEICETLPVALGRWLMRPHAVHRVLARFMHKGRVVTTSSLSGFLLLWGLARMRVWRRSSWRYAIEQERMEHWLSCIHTAATWNPALAMEVAQCQSVLKGYGDTHGRGWGNFNTLMHVVQQQGRHLAPATLHELRAAALADEQGRQLQQALQRHALV